MTASPGENRGGGFDVASWMQLIDEVQRLGFDTARNVAGRFATMADSALGAQQGVSARSDSVVDAWQSILGRAATPELQGKIFDAIESMTTAAIDVCLTAWDAVAETIPPGVMAGGTGSGGPRADNVLRLGSIQAGGTVTATAYVHFGGALDATEVELENIGLHAASGDAIPQSAVTLAPTVIRDPRPNGTTPVQVTVDVPESAAPGTYHGLVFTLIEPESVVNLRLEVLA